MPVFRHGGKLIYFAHIPKCGGSSVEDYILERFGNIALLDNRFTAQPRDSRWSRTSPQHVDWASLQRILPAEMFSAIFTVVRHPVARVVSAYHFQVDVERAVSPQVTFADWLRDQAAALEADRFILDNHFRPQVDFIPADARVFHLEHGLDAIVPYLDALAGDRTGPRFIGHTNQRRGGKAARVEPVRPSPADLTLIAQIYAADFARFGYTPGNRQPEATRPVIAAEDLAACAAGRSAAARPINRLATRVRRKLRL